jgi:hypothetical protein
MTMKRIFWGFCVNRFLMSTLQYLSSRSDFDFASRGVDKIVWSCPFFKLLNKSIVIVHYIPGFFFPKSVL